MTTWMHEQRLDAVLAEVLDSAAGSVLDLGCGDGDLFLRLAAMPGLDRLVGVDLCAASLGRLRERLKGTPLRAGSIALRHASMDQADPALTGFDCAVLVEAIEHVDPARLSRLERAVFGQKQPDKVILTTPNAEFNPLLGVPSQRFRHPDHRFEWPRAQFRRWGQRVAAAWHYSVRFRDIAGAHPELGGASQMAVFCKQADRGAGAR